jgi:hypothetical protein
MTIPAPSPPPQTNGYGWQIDIHGDYFITGNGGTGGGYTTIHNVSTGALITSFTGAARNVAIDENYAAACANGGPIKIFELATSTLTTFPDPNGGLADLMDISGNNLILAPNNGSLITVHDIPTALSNGNLNTTSLTINTTVSYFQTLIAGGNYLALGRTGAGDQSILIYDLTTGTLLHTLPAPVGASAAFGNAIDIKGNYLVAGHRGQEQYSPAAVYDLTTGILLQTFTGDDIPDTSTWQNPDIDILLGTAVAITDSKTIIGSSSGGESSNNAGAFLIYSNPGQEVQESTGPADWSNATLAYTLDNPNPHGTSENDQFGSAVAMSSTHAIVGTFYESDATSGTMAGKAYIYNIETGALLHTLDNPNPYGTSINDSLTGNDRFGFSVAISDTYAIVGAYQEDEAGGNSSGKAYIYSLSDGSLIKTLSNRNPDGSALGDLFGFSVAISDTYAIVGAWGEDWPSGGGAAYIYDISSLSSDGSVPSPTIIQNASTDSNAYFGWAVALSDNYVIVSAPNAFSSTGQAFVFNLSDGSLLYTFDNPNPDGAGSNDKFGGTASPYHSPTMLAISDNYAIVGAPHEDDASGDKSGKAYVFDLSDGSLAYTLDNPNPVGTSTEDYFGMAVDLDDDFVIVGAPYEDDAVSNLYPGKAYIYNLTDGSLVRTLDDPNAFGTTDGDRFGHSVAINDGIAIVSASREDDGSGTSSNSSGKAYIFNAPEAAPAVAPAVSADWSNVTLAHTLDNPNPHDTSTDDFFGNAVAMSDNYTIVGAYREYDAGAYSGKAYIFNSTTGALLHTLDNPNAYGTSTDDNFGSAVAISDDYAFVCTHSESNDSGKAYIFNVSDGSLAYTLDNPNLGYGTGANGDKFGYSCAISGDFVIASAVEENDINGTDSGIVYIFNVSDGSLVHTLINPNPYSTSTSDKFGYKVAISGDHAIVCARDEDDAGGSSSGKAYIYNVTTSALLHTLDNPNPYDTSRNDRFGFSCAISGDHAIVSAYAEDDANGVDSGKAYIFNVTTGALLHTLDNPNAYDTSQTDYFGYSVAMNDTHAIISASGEDGADGGNSGKAYIFDLSDGSLVSTVDNPNAYDTSAGDQFGLSVAMNDTHAVVGSIYESDWLGKAYIFSASV